MKLLTAHGSVSTSVQLPCQSELLSCHRLPLIQMETEKKLIQKFFKKILQLKYVKLRRFDHKKSIVLFCNTIQKFLRLQWLNQCSMKTVKNGRSATRSIWTLDGCRMRQYLMSVCSQLVLFWILSHWNKSLHQSLGRFIPKRKSSVLQWLQQMSWSILSVSFSFSAAAT